VRLHGTSGLLMETSRPLLPGHHTHAAAAVRATGLRPPGSQCTQLPRCCSKAAHCCSDAEHANTSAIPLALPQRSSASRSKDRAVPQYMRQLVPRLTPLRACELCSPNQESDACMPAQTCQLRRTCVAGGGRFEGTSPFTVTGSRSQVGSASHARTLATAPRRDVAGFKADCTPRVAGFRAESVATGLGRAHLQGTSRFARDRMRCEPNQQPARTLLPSWCDVHKFASGIHLQPTARGRTYSDLHVCCQLPACKR